jgi:predicted MPP superfamily phosphohydrolase
MKRFAKYIIAFLVIILLYTFCIEPNIIFIDKKTIESEKIPVSFDKMKIVQISDLHIKRFGIREREVLFFLKIINLKFVNEFLDRLDYETYATLGNWDYWAGDTEPLIRSLKNHRIDVLMNENRVLSRGKDSINIVGVSDPYTGHDNIDKAIFELDTGNFTILIAHAPDITLRLRQENFDLIICGHTHGGQVNIPFIKPFWIPSKTDFVKGMYETKWGKLYINRGIGTSGIPARFLCPPEITVFTLRSKK